MASKSHKSPVPVPPKHAGSHEIRIIGGQWKRSKLKVADKPSLRPTPDRVRETLFNWLGQDMGGLRVVDAFAGTGALGLEAASRGAAQVTLIEQDPALVLQLRQVLAHLQKSTDAANAQTTAHVVRGDAIAHLTGLPVQSVDGVFLDPPFGLPLFEPALRAAVRALKPTGWVYLEAPQAWDDVQLAAWGLRVHRHLKAGAVHAHLLYRTDSGVGGGVGAAQA
ncbi:16S rRNA (guanine(966)-N(2))-methyltransferase RsmD [Curvibacter sp. CHRR-16]|uniref:16S rRNA (guanine(966)-N(2))-methyltransferase RsmD n=1 Tax=Curvibacter sp. CHRR-16 TaxID=2835872 RepID=UPI001BD9B057|nr:16S rRNA (guanine(966)-N(2))-methyltransferase RsmD [Curvibacter sp. CHRR-16]MBT0569598.1 16S rRNA (guanine(966)-N(2))-methyltransferase RsmD [Curvibacter sp. CHRR-16]